jgi:hypothetical protein
MPDTRFWRIQLKSRVHLSEWHKTCDFLSFD